MALFLIDGISGTGKTTLSIELARRGYHAIDADEAFGYFGDPESGIPTTEKLQDNWIWDLDKIKSLAKPSIKEAIFVCGGAMNQDRVRDIFEKRFTLVIDDATMRHRLLNRTNNDFGKHPDELAKMLEWNKGAVVYANRIGSIIVDANQPISAVADDIINQALEG